MWWPTASAPPGSDLVSPPATMPTDWLASVASHASSSDQGHVHGDAKRLAGLPLRMLGHAETRAATRPALFILERPGMSAADAFCRSSVTVSSSSRASLVVSAGVGGLRRVLLALGGVGGASCPTSCDTRRRSSSRAPSWAGSARRCPRSCRRTWCPTPPSSTGRGGCRGPSCLRSRHPLPCTRGRRVGPCGRTTGRASPPLSPASTSCFTFSQSLGSVFSAVLDIGASARATRAERHWFNRRRTGSWCRGSAGGSARPASRSARAGR